MISPEGPEPYAAVHFLLNFPASRIYNHFSPIFFQTNRDFGDTRQGNFYLSGPLGSDRLGLAVRGNAFRRDAAALQSETVNGQQVSITSFGLSPTRSDIYNMGGRLSYVINDRHNIYADFDNLSQAYDNSNRRLGTVGVQGGYAEESLTSTRAP